MLVYKCDCNNCDNTTTDKVEDWLTIGSTQGDSLFIENGLKNNRLIMMNNHGNLHFCSKECLVDTLFLSQPPQD